MSEDIRYIRKTIDQLDGEIVACLTRRFRAARRIAEIKTSEGRSLFDGQREEEILERVLDAAEDPAMRESIRVIYQTLLAESKRYQNAGEER